MTSNEVLKPKRCFAWLPISTREGFVWLAYVTRTRQFTGYAHDDLVGHGPYSTEYRKEPVRAISTYTAQIFVGLREGYTDKIHSLDTVRGVLRQYAEEVGLCVTVTPTEFIYTASSECSHCGEPGAIVGLINYPRFPSSPQAIEAHAETIAAALKSALKQNRASIVYPRQTVMV